MQLRATQEEGVDFTFSLGEKVFVQRVGGAGGEDGAVAVAGTVIQKTSAVAEGAATGIVTYVIKYPGEAPGARQNKNGKWVEVGVHPSRLQSIPQESHTHSRRNRARACGTGGCGRVRCHCRAWIPLRLYEAQWRRLMRLQAHT